MERKGAKTQGKGEGWKIGRVEEWKGAGTNLTGRGQVQDLPLRVLVLCPL